MIVSTGFYYDGEYSGDKNVIKVRTSGGLSTESFIGSITNNIIKPKYRNKSYVQEAESEPLVIPMALYFDNSLDETSSRIVKKWLKKDDFKELIFEDQPDRVYYAKIDGEVNLSHNSVASGYIEFDFLTNSAYAFSRLIEIDETSDSEEEYKLIVINNDGDTKTQPKIKLTMNPTTPTDIEIINDTTGEHLILKNNLVNETIVIWNEYEEFETSSALRYCYDDHIGSFISLAEGANELRVKGIFDFTIEYQYVYL